MMQKNVIRVFEHDYLPVDGEHFTLRHWKTLGDYNLIHGDRFFTLRPNGIKFSQYVGVVQVGEITIEILPKIGRTSPENQQDKWQRVLFEMLNECRWMRLFANENAKLSFRHNSILEAYLELFLNECEVLLHGGLLKKYRAQEANRTTLKGKLIFPKHIRQNSIHQERFYTRCQVYDRNNIYNQILYKALLLTPLLTDSPILKDRLHTLLLDFPELDNIKVNEELFKRLVFGRKELHYKAAIEIAAMLLLNYRPDISSGRNHILALLFDMNDLWEEYVFRKLASNKPEGWEIQTQNRRIFWEHKELQESKQIRPDIVIKNTSSAVSIILDTKWKIPDGSIPADADLKQIFVYNEYWNSQYGILVYPSEGYSETIDYSSGSYIKRENKEPELNCGMLKISVLNKEETGLDREIGERIRNFLVENILVSN